jgi:hypothetical protein
MLRTLIVTTPDKTHRIQATTFEIHNEELHIFGATHNVMAVFANGYWTSVNWESSVSQSPDLKA